ncbi:MAG: hypothetical protein ACLRS8_19240 [Parabacteroides merdae]
MKHGRIKDGNIWYLINKACNYELHQNIKYPHVVMSFTVSLISPGLLSSAQNVDSSIQLKGMVVDEFGKPISGALLKSEKGKCEYLTKVDGTYEFNLKDGSQYIAVSYIGYSDKIVS